MKCRRQLFALGISALVLSCGGEARQGSPGGEAGASTGSGGLSGLAGNASSHSGSTSGGSASTNGGSASTNGGSASTNGGNANGGSGGAVVCCLAFPTCPAGERQAVSPECPGQASCHQVSICCSSIWCVTSDEASAGGAAGSGAGGTHDCNGLTCTASQACVAYRTDGGVVLPPDSARTCPTGTHLEGSRCARDFAYQCAERHGTCQNEPISCACAEPDTNNPGVCPAGYGSCSAPSANAVAPSTELVCQQLVP
ncbi:MAG TPA: hypothetical protein VFK05_15890 [Polyangiaceae bacterium]|nr:hypothetical protein [Polyangiaceae bacterium]